jgi:XrtJ-associated TM-motif-TM protein
MNKTRFAIFSALAILIVSISLNAQGTGGGCVDSPEAPTALLLLVGSAGIFYGPYLLRKVLRRGGNK